MRLFPARAYSVSNIRVCHKVFFGAGGFEMAYSGFVSQFIWTGHLKFLGLPPSSGSVSGDPVA